MQAQRRLAATLPLAEAQAADHDAVFYPGGHGPLWDLAEDPRSVKLIQNMLAAGKPVAAVCHAPGVLRHARTADGKPMVQGRQVTGFSNAEEAAVGLSQIVPFLVEDELVRLGAQYSRAEDWQPHVIADGLLITGQNPASSVRGGRGLAGAPAPVNRQASETRRPARAERAAMCQNRYFMIPTRRHRSAAHALFDASRRTLSAAVTVRRPGCPIPGHGCPAAFFDGRGAARLL